MTSFKCFLKAVLISVTLLWAYTTPAFGVDLSSKSELKIGISQEFKTINPVLMNMAASTYVGQMVLRRLMYVDENWKWKCSLCTEIPSLKNGQAVIVKEKTGKKLIVNWQIKKDYRWGDGTPLTAKDFKLAWEIGRSPNVSIADKDTYEKIEAFEIDPINPLKFTTKFKEPMYNFYQLPLYALPFHLENPIWQKTKEKSNEYEKQSLYTTNPENPALYNGPYLVSKLKLGNQIRLNRNKFFGGKRAAIDSIIIRLISNTQALEAALISGTIDLVSEIGMTFDQAKSFEQRISKVPTLRDKFKVHYRNGLVYEHIDFNLTNPILKDPRVRKALIHAIDRDKLCLFLFSGKQKKAVSNIHPIDPYFNEKVLQYEHSVEKAKLLLDKAGWKLAKDGYRYKKDKKLSLSLMTTANNKTREHVQSLLRAEWKKVGISINIRNETPKVFFGETVRRAKYPGMAMFAWTSSPDSPPRSTLHSSMIPTADNGWSGQNSNGWKNKKVDQLLDKIISEFDFKKRKGIMDEIQDEYKKGLPVIPLYLRAQIAITPKGLKNFALTGHEYSSSNMVEMWELGNQGQRR